MPWRAVGWSTVLLAALALGVGGAVGRPAASTTTVRVEVIGQGEIVDDKNQLDCGVVGHTLCRVSYTGSGTVTDSVGDETAGGWTLSELSGCGTPCTVGLDQADDDHELVATFVTASNPGEKTLTVQANGDANDDGGNIVAFRDGDGDDAGTRRGDVVGVGPVGLLGGRHRLSR